MTDNQLNQFGMTEQDMETINRILKTEFNDSSLLYRVDIANLQEINYPGLKENIKKVGIVFYKKED